MQFKSKDGRNVDTRLAAKLLGSFLVLVAAQAGAQTLASVTLAWNPSVDPRIAGYYLYQGTASHNYTQQIDEGNVTQATVTGLTPGLTYYFAVSAYDTIGLESMLSPEISYTPPLSPPAITLTVAKNGSGYTAPATISLAATVISNGHMINKVGFYNGTTLLGQVTAAPYNFTWTNVNPGTYNLTAVASYDGGSTLASSLFSVTVSPLYDGLNLGDPSQALVDSDGDGLTNLVEYALGTDPGNPTDANKALIFSITQQSGNPYLTMKFKCRTNATALSLQYLPQVSGDKVTWYSDNTHVLSTSVTPLDTQFNWVTVRDTTPIIPTAPRFMSLHVILGNLQSASPVCVGSDSLIRGTNLTLFSARMVRPILSAGIVSALNGAVLTDTNAPFTDGEFGTNGTAAYVEFDNGVTADIADSSAATKKLVLAGSLGAVAGAGDAYRIRPHFTVASLFGTNNETGLSAGLNPSQADTILLKTPQTQRAMTIFYFSNALARGWYRADYSPAADQVIYPEQGVLVHRIAPSPLNLYLCGPIRSGLTIAPIEPGSSIVGTLMSLSTRTLDSLNLYTGDSTTGLAPGLNPSASDKLLLLQSNGTMATFFYLLSTNGNAGWRDAAYNPAGNTPIPAGSAFIIKRQPSNGPFNWTIPAE
jgi:hypothetical protein